VQVEVDAAGPSRASDGWVCGRRCGCAVRRSCRASSTRIRTPSSAPARPRVTPSPAGAGSFWTWRQAMYSLVESLDEATFFRLTLQAFREMRAAGRPRRRVPLRPPLARRRRLSRSMTPSSALPIGPASGFVLLQTLLPHRRHRPAARRRPDALPHRVDRALLESVDALRERLKPATQSLGAVAHSLRAATRTRSPSSTPRPRAADWSSTCTSRSSARKSPTASRSTGRGRPWPSSAAACLAEERRRGALHAHRARRPRSLRRQAAGRICVCPTTEGNLGDGLQDVRPGGGRPPDRDAFLPGLGLRTCDRLDPLRGVALARARATACAARPAAAGCATPRARSVAGCCAPPRPAVPPGARRSGGQHRGPDSGPTS
jgi:hypothetical protein